MFDLDGLFDLDFDGDVDVADAVTSYMLANGELTGDNDSTDDVGFNSSYADFDDLE